MTDFNDKLARSATLRKVSPGWYVDENGAVHVYLKEMLEAHGYADTPHNRAMIEQVLREQLPNALITEARDE